MSLLYRTVVSVFIFLSRLFPLSRFFILFSLEYSLSIASALCSPYRRLSPLCLLLFVLLSFLLLRTPNIPLCEYISRFELRRLLSPTHYPPILEMRRVIEKNLSLWVPNFKLQASSFTSALSERWLASEKIAHTSRPHPERRIILRRAS